MIVVIKILSICGKKNKKPLMTNILIFRTDRIGDLLVTCPTIITIKKYFKGSNIELVASSMNYDYANNLNIFDKVYQFPEGGIFRRIYFIFKLY